ncbi:hypothetical protein [Streptomyces sp. OV198]|uniref:hypothetical protein n=1 Tax=Streptomyces sp. OV198 TaxID=1882787 RepID=UPI00117C4F2E|nr:hypothetical protein [Streptomyces sp. OV198]
MMQLWGDQKDENETLTQRVIELTEANQQISAEREQPVFHLGKRPEGPEEIEAEVRLREIERRWEVELADRKHRADLSFDQYGLIRRAEGVRGWALVAVVFAIIASPWVAMITGVAAKDFSLYVTPVTGIAGAIIGYWFGQGQQNDIRPPTTANSPPPDTPFRTAVVKNAGGLRAPELKQPDNVPPRVRGEERCRFPWHTAEPQPCPGSARKAKTVRREIRRTVMKCRG